ncbi:unnamed protein product [Caenorhabditis angaria]|uniref:Uncharacterized protein n=1 Tax=Caenorhabditis angaria TaxID=860376 RepID=A0A9P1IXG2_9PELO|nr:unnamed protein product [Caenorhabditis angaria]
MWNAPEYSDNQYTFPRPPTMPPHRNLTMARNVLTNTLKRMKESTKFVDKMNEEQRNIAAELRNALQEKIMGGTADRFATPKRFSDSAKSHKTKILKIYNLDFVQKMVIAEKSGKKHLKKSGNFRKTIHGTTQYFVNTLVDAQNSSAAAQRSSENRNEMIYDLRSVTIYRSI